MLEMILLKSCTFRVLEVWENAAYKPCGTMYSDLATVWSEWWYRMTTYWFTLTIKKRLKQINPLGRYLSDVQCVNKVGVPNNVWGLALLDNELFIASIYESVIHVHDKTSCIKRRTLLIEALRSPRDIAISVKHRCLYVIDASFSQGTLYVIDPSSAATLASWTVAGTPGNLSVSSSTGNVFVTCAKKVREYTRGGTLVRNIPLSKEMAMSWQAVPLPAGDFIICQGWGDTRYHRVCWISSTGSVVRCRGSCAGSDTDQFRDPVHACFDPYGFIIVADSGNNRVRLLSSKNLVPLRDLVISESADNCPEPYRAILDPSSGLLYVGTSANGVLVYRVRRQSSHWY